MGGILLIFPVVFKQSGFISTTFVLILSGYMSYKTAYLYVIHSRHDDNDIEHTTLRALGK